MVSELTSRAAAHLRRLGVPPGKEPIHVYLFADEAAYRAARRAEVSRLPRAAGDLRRDRRRSCRVYAHWSDASPRTCGTRWRTATCTRRVPNLPLWLDEGLAEYFEVGRGRRGVNRTHVDYLRGQLATAAWQPDLPRLEQLAAAGDMTQLDYAEAWLWVHFLLERRSDGKPAAADRLS